MKKWIFIFAILLIGLISANGLSVSINEININKTENEHKSIQLTIQNQEPLTFYNITSDNPEIDFSPFNLESGKNKTFNINVVSTNNVNKEIRIYGFIKSNVGQSNKTEIVNIDYDSGFDKCDLNLIVGDKVKWNNNVLDSIKLKKEDGEEITTINQESNYTKTFNYPENFNYYASRIGSFTELCNINVRNSSGFIHDAQYDALLDLNVKIIYEPTTIQTTFLKDNYKINYNEKKTDLFLIENTGNKVAKVELSGDWFKFSENSFDIAPGDSKSMSYTINPIIWEANQTGKNYSKFLIISGNFNEVKKEIKIEMPYKNIGSSIGNSTLDEESLKSLITYLCLQHPEWEECQEKVVYTNKSNSNVSIQFSYETWKALQERQLNFEDKFETIQKQENEIEANQTNRLSSLESNMSFILSELKKSNSLTENSNSISLFLGIIFLAFVCMGILGFAIYRKIKSNKYDFYNFGLENER